MNLAVTYDHESTLKAQKEAGADIVIVGVERFSMRMKSPLSLEALEGVVKAAHACGMACWANLNAPIHEPDLDMLKTTLNEVLATDIDKVLFADLAVFNVAGKATNRLIYHPDTYATDLGDSLFFAREGIGGIVAGRELTIDAIETMSEGPLPVVIVGHGHLPMFHSRRPLVEHYVEHTGDATPDTIKTKKTLTLVESTREEAYPIVQDGFGTHVFRAKPTASFAVLERLKNVVDTLVVDGLWFSPDVVLDTLSDYRASLSGKAPRQSYDHCDTGFYDKRTVTMKEDV